MANKKKGSEPSLDELLAQTSELTNSLMRNIYQDFYGAKDPQKAAADKNAEKTGASMEKGTDDSAPKEDSLTHGRETVKNRKDVSADKPLNESADKMAGETESVDQAAEVTASTGKTTEEAKPEKSGQEQLDELIGLANIKHDVKELTSLMKVQKLRQEKGLKYVPTSLHLVFAGNPGTGKTTVARILGQLYKEIGVLSKGQLIEVDRSGLVAGYVGQTAITTQEKIEQAKGGILFVDEAYTLAKEGNDFGQEAIDTILKAMEDNREDLVVIVAGYTEPMMKFINSNPGLRSRFNKYLYFEDYTADELNAIFDLQCRKYSYHMSDETREKVRESIREIEENKDDNFANAREIRNLFEEIITNQASRVAEIDDPTEEELTEIRTEDLEDADDIKDAETAETIETTETAETTANTVGEVSAVKESAVDVSAEKEAGNDENDDC